MSYAKADFEQVLDFLRLCMELGRPLWIRHVVVPTITDSHEHIRALCEFVLRYPNLKKLELLPFRKICLGKYESMGIDFPLSNIPEATADKIRELTDIVKEYGIPI